MREPLFRGKRTSNVPELNGQWIHGYLWKEGEYFVIAKNIMSPGFVDPETVGQYTGMKDKNGVKIFEGDIVQFEPTEEEDAAKVVFRLGCWMLVFGNDGNDEYLYDRHRDTTIIGNIHDNDIEEFINA